jgi:hypothetical protein
MAKEDANEFHPDVEIVLKKVDELLNGPPVSRGELERLYRTNRSRKIPLKSREQIEAPLQQGLTYLHVQGSALDSVRNVLGRLEDLLDKSGAGVRRRKALKLLQLDLILLGDTQFNGYATFNSSDDSDSRIPFYFPDGLGKVFIRQLNLSQLLGRILQAEGPDELDAIIVRQSTISINEMLGQISAATDELESNFQMYSERFASHSGNEFTDKPVKKSWLSAIFQNTHSLNVQANVDPALIKVVRRREKENN